MNNHLPQPGPVYWSWRCTQCGEPTRTHPSLVRLLVNWIARKETT